MAKARSEVIAEQFKRDLSLHYLGAKLQRAKTIPRLDKLTGENRKAPTLKNIVDRLNAAPSYEPKG